MFNSAQIVKRAPINEYSSNLKDGVLSFGQVVWNLTIFNIKPLLGEQEKGAILYTSYTNCY